MTGLFSARIGLLELVLAGVLSTFVIKNESSMIYIYMYVVQSSGYIYKIIEPVLFLNISFKHSRKARETFADNKYNRWAWVILLYT